MTPWYESGGVQIMVGHVLDVLAEMPAGSVQCCVTSPPYWGLRSYSTEPQIWGGDPLCSHTLEEAAHGKVLTGGTGTASAKQVSNAGSQYGNAWKSNGQSSQRIRHGSATSGLKNDGRPEDGRLATNARFAAEIETLHPSQGATCTRCGAWRGELGSEPTPQLYVEHIVEVFRAVRRVLHDTGTVFLNLGDSYSSGDGRRAGAYDMPDTTPVDSRGRDCLCRNLCGACRAAYQLGRLHNGSPPAPTLEPSLSAPSHEHTVSALAHPPTSGLQSQASRTVHATPHPGQTLDPEGALPLDAQASMIDGYALQPPESRSEASTQGDGCQLCGRSLLDSAQGSAHIVDDDVTQSLHRADTASPSAAPSLRTQDTCACYSLPATQHFPTKIQPYCTTLGPKQLLMMPARVALALQADGWVLRADIIWSKPNPMPESVTDRPTKAHEYLFLLSKRADYFYDAEAIKEPAIHAGEFVQTNGNRGMDAGYDGHRTRDGCRRGVTVADGRNRRSVWSISTEAYPAAHFATFPRKLVEPCILAGSSARGQCPACGAPWRRVVEHDGRTYRQIAAERGGPNGYAAAYSEYAQGPQGLHHPGHRGPNEHIAHTAGWEQACKCQPQEPIPQTVLDCFLGSGTTAFVARHHGRRAIGIELSEAYAALAADRLKQGTLGLEVW